jgi:hypothetical protein
MMTQDDLLALTQVDFLYVTHVVKQRLQARDSTNQLVVIAEHQPNLATVNHRAEAFYPHLVAPTKVPQVIQNTISRDVGIDIGGHLMRHVLRSRPWSATVPYDILMPCVGVCGKPFL